MSSYALGIDIGGTFTDVVLADEHGTMYTSKVLSSTDDLSRACIDGLQVVLAKAGIDGSSLDRVVHATTQATNVLLERTQPLVPFLITEGFKDLLDICANGRWDLYDLLWDPWRPPTNGMTTWEVPERIGGKGQLFLPLDEDAVHKIADEIAPTQPASVAVCLLHSYAHPEHEQRVGEILRSRLPGTYVALSSEVWPEHREYQRAVATVLSAYIAPVMSGYLRRLQADLKRRGVKSDVHVMQSNGGAMSVEGSVARPLHSIESGPAAGALAAGYIGRLSGFNRLIGFDMGGTTAKASLIDDGKPRTRATVNIGGRVTGGFDGVQLQLPVLDLVEVGAGGGSIARIDSGGLLQIGPDSAGSVPGPACYGNGGTRPTVTDANLILGYLSPDYFLGGAMALRRDLAERAFEEIADHLGYSLVEAAAAVHDLVNVGMEDAIRLVTIARGLDPRDYAAMAFGGAGPTHAARLAEAFDIRKVIVPPVPGLFSTVGLLASDVVYEETNSLWLDFDKVTADVLNSGFEAIERGPMEDLRKNGFTPDMIAIERTANVRRARQVHNMAVPVRNGALGDDDVAGLSTGFNDAWEKAYGVRRESPLVLESLHVRVVGRAATLSLAAAETARADATAQGSRPVYFRELGGYTNTPVYQRATLGAGATFPGPAIVEETESTTVVPPSWNVTVDGLGNLVLNRG